jgi:LDH2 family malate/lactate/ureidoglycolate dehydrogenase
MGGFNMGEYHIYPREIQSIVTKVFRKIGVNSDDAVYAGKVLAESDARGVDSHGIARLSLYYNYANNGMINKNAQFELLKETDTTAYLDAQAGFGVVMGPKANEIAIQKAKEFGIGMVGVKNTGHFGIAGYYSLEAAKQGLIGLTIATSGPAMVPFGGSEKILGNSPWSIAFPPGNKYKDPIMLDMACSQVAWGKLEVLSRTNSPVPDGWAVNKDGLPEHDPNKVYALLPFGGPKGYCIAVMWEMMTTVLLGGPHATGQGSPFIHKNEEVTHTFLVIDPEKFRPLDDIRESIDSYADMIKNSAPAVGQTEVFLPGEIEWKNYHKRVNEGFELNPVVADTVMDICKGYNLLDEQATFEDLRKL